MIHGTVPEQVLHTVIQDYNDCLKFLASEPGVKRVHGMEFYQRIFPANQMSGNYATGDTIEPNAIYQYTMRKRTDENLLATRIMLNDTWPNDYKVFVDRNPGTLCSGLTYMGQRNTLRNARRMHAMIFDLDSVGKKEIRIMFARFGTNPKYAGAAPRPTYVIMSGGGLHLYYVLDTPLELYPNTKLEARALKHALTQRIWHKGETSRIEMQSLGIAQSFRMPGSLNSKYNLEVLAFEVGPRVSIDYLNSYVKAENRVLSEAEYKASLRSKKNKKKYTLDDWRRMAPDWYNRRIVRGEPPRDWHVSRAFYDNFLARADEVQGGHRYFYMMALAVVAIKCNIDKSELEADLMKVYETLRAITHTNDLVMDDLNNALKAYKEDNRRMTRDTIERLSGIKFKLTRSQEGSKRPQLLHLALARNARDNNYIFRGRNPGEWINRDGAPAKDHLVREWRAANPNCNNKSKCARETGLSRPTVHKWWDACAPN